MNECNSIIFISASGYLESDCEVKTDKNGHNYIRFKIISTTKDATGKYVDIPFRCFTYNMKFAYLRQGDIVFVMGDFKYSKFKEKINFDIYVQQITHGGISSPKQINQ